MGLDMWFKPDVARILSATFEAMQATAAATGQPLPGYREGFGAALRAVAAGFGLAAPSSAAWRSDERSDGQAGEWSGTGSIVDGQVGHTGRAFPRAGEGRGEEAAWKGMRG